jgi:hypothetical protein
VYLGNVTPDQTVIRVEARKSFALALWLTNEIGQPLDITGASIRLVAKDVPLAPTGSTDTDNILTNGDAVLTDPAIGYAQIFLQASDLDHQPDEYPMTLVMVTEGYSTVLAKGILEILPNSEYASVGEAYIGQNPAQDLTIALQGQNVLTIRTGPSLAPGALHFMAADKAKLDSIEEGAQVNDPPELPAGGATNSVLAKNSPADRDTKWISVQSLPGGPLDATGIPDGFSPVADGSNNWDWAPVVQDEIDADIIVDGTTNKAYTAAEQTKLAGLTKDYTALDNLPTLGSASAQDSTAFAAAAHNHAGGDITTGTVPAARLPRIGDILGNGFGTAAPTGGSDGDEYFQYTP